MLPTLCDFPGGKPRRCGVLRKSNGLWRKSLGYLTCSSFRPIQDRFALFILVKAGISIYVLEMSFLPTELCQHIFFSKAFFQIEKNSQKLDVETENKPVSQD